MATGWGFYWIYDAAQSNKIAEAVYFANLEKLVVIGYGEETVQEFVDFPLPNPLDTARKTLGTPTPKEIAEHFSW